MPYRPNPFLERMSERTSDQEFVRLFSPKILEKLAEDAFEGAVHVFRSPPGGGKTTLLRAFTPSALRAFWNARRAPDMSEATQRLVAQGVLNDQTGPQILGVLLSCSSGYADLPPGAALDREGLFRALFDCRVVLRTLRSLAVFLGQSSNQNLDKVKLEYDALAKDFKSIPTERTASELIEWAEKIERTVYAELDSMGRKNGLAMQPHVRFEGVLWLQAVRFIVDGQQIASRRLLMIDDVHKLRRKQRAMLIEELTELRPTIPVWLAERNIALGEQLIAQGTREGRDVRHYPLEDLWSGRGQYQFATFAQNILDRRLDAQSEIPSGAFAQYLRGQLNAEDVRDQIGKSFAALHEDVLRYRNNPRYTEWVARVETNLADPTLESLHDIYTARILLARDALKKQMSLELAPLPAEELDQRDNSQVGGAADIFLHEELNIPYYFGLDRLCIMATNNVEELLFLAAKLYDALRAKQILRRSSELLLSPKEQEKLLKDSAAKKRDFIPKNHTEGSRGQRLLDAIGSYCRERTFLPNAPYAPGVTGVRVSLQELGKLNAKKLGTHGDVLMKVLAECVAENLLVSRQSAASTARDGGTVFYLNRTLCAYYDLPLQTGGWQDIDANKLVEWMERGRIPSKLQPLGVY
jgi:hypothetical protein